jgi:hypothetical protein
MRFVASVVIQPQGPGLAPLKHDAEEASVSVKKLGSGVTELASLFGPAAGEMAERLEGVGVKIQGIVKLIPEMGTMLPVVVALAAAVAILGAAWAGLEFLKDVIQEGMKTQDVIEQLNATLQSNGSASGLSAHEMVEFAESLALSTGRSKEQNIAALTTLSRFEQLKGNFKEVVKLTLDLAQAKHIDADAAANILGPAYEGNAKSLTKLKDIGVVLTAGQKASLTAMVEHGEVVKYQALLTDILTQKIAGLAEAHGKTLPGMIERGKAVYGEFKEAIASEVIPALEDVLSTLVDQLGGWENLKLFVKSAGHDIGDAVRLMVYGAMGWFLQWEMSWNEGMATIESTTAQAVDTLGKAAAFIAKAPGMSAWAAAANVAAGIADELRDSAMDDVNSLIREQVEYAHLEQKVGQHRQALEGDTNVIQSNGSALDKVAAKVKEHAGLLEAAARSIQNFSNKLADETQKLTASVAERAKLNEALGQGLLQYLAAKEAEDRESAIRQATLPVLKEQRTLVEALSAEEKKARDAHDPAAAEKIAADLKFQRSLFPGQIAATKQLAEANYDLGKANAYQLGVLQEDQKFSEALRSAQAALSDVMAGTSRASRDMAVSLDVERAELVAASAAAPRFAAAYVAAAALRIRARHDELNLIKDQTAGEQKLQDLLANQRQAVAVSQIQAQDSHLQAVEEQYLAFLQGLGGKTVEETGKLFQLLADKEGITVDQLALKIKDAIAEIDDAKLAASVKGAGKSTLQVYQEERAAIERLMYDSTSRVRITVEDGQAKIEELTRAHYQSLLSDVSSALGFLADQFGGFFAKLQNLVNSIQQAQSAGQSVGNIASSLGGNGAAIGGAVGGALTMVAVLRAIYEFDKAREEADRLRQYTLGAVATGRYSGGTWGISGTTDAHGQLTQQSRDASKAINDAMLSIADAIGGTLKQFEYIEIRVRNDGKYFQAFVGQQFIGTFDSQKAATDAAIRAALISANTVFTGLTAIVRQGLQELRDGLTGQTFDVDQIQDFLSKLKQISDLGKSQGAIQLESTLKGFNDLWQTLEQLKNVTPEVIQGFQNLTAAEVSAWESWRRSITGQQETAAEQLADKQQEALLFNDEKKLRIAELQLRLVDLQSQAAALQARGQLARINNEIDRGQLQNYENFLKIKAGLSEIDGSITGTELSVLQAAIAAIQQLITDLQNIPDINPGDIHLPRQGHGGQRSKLKARGSLPFRASLTQDLP